MAEPAPAPPRAELRLFGRIALRTPEGEDVALKGRRVRALLAYVALQRDGRAPRARLAGLLWSDRAEPQARASLRQALTELRGAVAAFLRTDPVVATREHIALRLEALEVDARALEAALDGGDAAALPALLERIGADVLCDEPAVGDLHQEWLDETRSHFETRIASEVHDRLARIGPSEPRAARRLAEAFLRRQPLDEAAAAALMLADVALGASASAVIRYAALKRALARELGVTPGPLLQSALAAALASSLEPPPAPPSPVAAPAPEAEGREWSSVPTVIVAGFEEADLPAHGVRDEVLAALSRFRELSVLSDPRPADQIPRAPWGRRQDVYLLTGTVAARDGGARVTVQLVHLADGAVVWSDRAVLPADAEAGLLDRVVARISGAVNPSIQHDLGPRAARSPAGAHARYLVARDAAARAETFDQARAAAAALEALIAEAPEASLPYLPLARLYNTDFGFTRAGASGAPERARALELAKTALALDRGFSHGYTVTGWCYLWRRDWAVADRYFDQAVELNPFSADRLMEAGFGRLFLGDLDGARRLLERCVLLNPVPRDGFFMDLGLLELIEGRYALAQAHFDMVASPTLFDDIYSATAAVMAGEASAERSARAFKRLLRIWPPGEPPTAAAAAAWFWSRHPFRDAGVQARLSDAVLSALAPR